MLFLARSTRLGLLLAALTACSRGAAPLPPIQARHVLLSLLDYPELREVVEQNPAHAIEVDVMRPRASGEGEFGGLPAIEVTPPCEVVFRVPELPPGALLEFATAARRQSFAGQGAVHYTLELDGEELFQSELSVSESLPEEERKWHFHEVPLGSGRLTLRTRYEGDQARAPRCGVGKLEVTLPAAYPRRRAGRARPNVVLIVIDTLRADRLACYGGPEGVSPHLDALAARGLLFASAFAPASWTVPSTASILTALSPSEHGLGFASSNVLAHGLVTVAEVMQTEGVTTGAFSCNNLISASRNFHQGFEHFREYPWNPAREAVIDDALAWIEAQRESQFFAYLHLVDPHGPYLPAEEFRPLYARELPPGHDPDPVPTMERLLAGATFEAGSLERYSALNLRLYDGEIASVDQQLGRLFARLEELGLARDTLVALTSDHGEEFLEHGLLGHANQLHDELLRVPLILAGPGVPAGERVAERVELQALAPTLARLAGVELRGRLAGPDLLSERERRAASQLPLFAATRLGRVRLPGREGWSQPRPLYAVRHGNWLMHWAPPLDGTGVRALYDLWTDPEARVDLAAQRTEVVEELSARIAAWIEQGRTSRPTTHMSGEADEEIMRQLGYLGGD